MSNILSQTAWLPLNKNVLKDIGLDASVILSYLIDKSELFELQGTIPIGGYFFNEQKIIQKAIGLSPYRQQLAIEILTNKGLIETKRTTSMPPRILYKTNNETILDYVYSLHKSKI
jgi:hypothetical protein